jgi:hypothetical protein
MRQLAWVVALVCSACGPDPGPRSREVVSEPAPVEPEPWSDAWLEREGLRYLDEPEFRRAQLETSLTTSCEPARSPSRWQSPCVEH